MAHSMVFRSITKLEDTRQSILDMFSRYDENGDGLISRNELHILIRVLDKSGSLQNEGIDFLMTALDRNCDGFVDTEEFVEWVMSAGVGDWAQFEDKLGKVATTHVFLTPQDEAVLERFTMWELRAEQNNSTLTDAGCSGLDDPSLLFLSVGSSSTQVYDAQGLAKSFPVGTSVQCLEAYEALTEALKDRERERGVKYERVLLMNSIGYQLYPTDPRLLALAQLSDRAELGVEGALVSTCDFHTALLAALPEAVMLVYNRAKDPITKRYKYQQVVNDFSEALANERGLRLCSHAGSIEGEVQDAIVDWGGSSFKVYVDGKRVGTEIMDANGFLCEGGVLRRDRIPQAIRQIELFVVNLLPEVRRIFIAQTGQARNLALRQGIFSCS